MPELLEIEMYRRGASRLVGRTIAEVDAPDDWYLKNIDSAGVTAALVGATIESLGRLGKLMMVETSSATVGLRFGMTGILVVDGEPIIEQLEYSSSRLDPAWNRFTISFASGGRVDMNDPRRLGGVELNPDLSRFGPDAWSLGLAELRKIFGRSKSASKTLLLNQGRIAGLGNLLVDELLWRCGISPLRPANTVGEEALQTMAVELGPMLDELYQRGGSHRGDHFPERHADGHCPKDGSEMSHAQVGGRSSWWCQKHQS